MRFYSEASTAYFKATDNNTTPVTSHLAAMKSCGKVINFCIKPMT